MKSKLERVETRGREPGKKTVTLGQVKDGVGPNVK